MLLPKEAGEKAFALDEELTPSRRRGAKLLSAVLRPEIIDQKVMSDKVVFRGRPICTPCSVPAMGNCAVPILNCPSPNIRTLPGSTPKRPGPRWSRRCPAWKLRNGRAVCG